MVALTKNLSTTKTIIMKTKFYIFYLLSLWSITGLAQISTQQQAVIVDSGEAQLANSLQTVFADLEKDRIPNGLLLDAAIEFANLKKYAHCKKCRIIPSVKYLASSFPKHWNIN